MRHSLQLLLGAATLSAAFAMPSTQDLGGPVRLPYADCFGRSVVSPGDLDGDGIPDLVVSAPWQARGHERAAGAVFAFSGRDGKELYRFFGCGPGHRIGNGGRLAAVGDVDGDGVGDFLVTRKQGVELRSGKDGTQIREHDWPAFAWEVKTTVAGLGDVDGDGVPDYAIGDRGWESDRGLVRLFSGSSGELLRELQGDEAGDWFGFALACGMDFDGDGVPDLLVGAPRGNVAEVASSPRVGYARVHSGADGRVLATVLGLDASDCFGQAVCFLGDLDGDGRAELAVGAPGQQPDWKISRGSPGYVRIYSGGSGELLRTIEGPESPFSGARRFGKEEGSCAYNSEFGFSVAAAGDVDGDGIPDLVVAARREDILGGSARVYSGRTGALLHERIGPAFRDWGHLVGALGDLDGDGHGDFFHVALNDSQGAGSIGALMLISGKQGDLLWRLESPLRPTGGK